MRGICLYYMQWCNIFLSGMFSHQSNLLQELFIKAKSKKLPDVREQIVGHWKQAIGHDWKVYTWMRGSCCSLVWLWFCWLYIVHVVWWYCLLMWDIVFRLAICVQRFILWHKCRHYWNNPYGFRIMSTVLVLFQKYDLT